MIVLHDLLNLYLIGTITVNSEQTELLKLTRSVVYKFFIVALIPYFKIGS
jgi:hypothetical protein